MRLKPTSIYTVLLVSFFGLVYGPAFGENENKRDVNITQTDKESAPHPVSVKKDNPTQDTKQTVTSANNDPKKLGFSGERIVFMRHGEKPAQGLGQLSCKGLNRALALPDVLIDRYGVPNSIYAPNPGDRKPDQSGILYNYIRPLATIEPTAIRLGLPVNTNYGYDQIEALKKELLAPQNEKKQHWVVWEHKEIVNLERAIFKEYGLNSDLIGAWESNEFDRLDVLNIHKNAQGLTEISYQKEKQGLDGQPEKCAHF